MSKRISKILSILLSASLAAASVPVIPLAAYADDGTTSSTSETQDPGGKKQAQYVQPRLRRLENRHMATMQLNRAALVHSV